MAVTGGGAWWSASVVVEIPDHEGYRPLDWVVPEHGRGWILTAEPSAR